MLEIKEIQPLAGDPKRQATDILKGFVYQVWQSLYIWIHLKEDEILVLEGAEDIDNISQEEATTIQVKNITSKNITLNSDEVLDAIVNYWNLCQKDTRKIKFQFLTTANRGKEKGNAGQFSGVSGLDFWDLCKTSTNVTPLRNFLLKITTFPQSLKDFIKSSSDEELLDKLIRPISWLTSEGDLGATRKKVEDALVIHGEKNNSQPNESKSAALYLIDLIWTKICDGAESKRMLNRADFLTAFQISQTELISRSQLRMISEQMSKQDSFMHTYSEQFSKLFAEQGEKKINFAISKPYIVDKSIYIVRQNLVDQVKRTMETANFILIRGSSGMGKSILSLQAVESNRDEWERISFRGLSGANINEMLYGLYDYYLPKSTNVLLDDINFGSDYQVYSDSFERLVKLVNDKGKKVMVTSQKQLPQQLVLKLNLSTTNDFSVTKFSESEISSLLTLNTCPANEIDLWTKDIEFTTRSHPQLVHARIVKLKLEGWDKTKIMFKTEELAKVKHEVVTNLVSEIPSKEARDLLLRLSILTGAFSRKNALALAKYPPEIPTPGIIFNQLVGPYIEQDTADSYRLSPLLDNAFQENFPPNEIKKLHELAGESYLSQTLSPNDLFNIFLHGIQSGSGKIMFFAFAAFQSIKGKYKKLIYPHIEFLIYVHIGTGRPAFENDDILNLMFRHIQFTLAVETGNLKQALNIADTWFEEVKAFKNISPFKKEPQAKLFPFMFFISVFRYTDIEIPIEKCITWILGAYAFIKSNPEINSIFKRPPVGEVSSWKELMPEIALTKRINSSNIEKFMESIPDTQEGKELLSVMDSHDTLPKRIADNVWLDQIDKENPDWIGAVKTLEKLKEVLIKRKALNIAALTIRAIAIIKNEYLQDEEGAKRELIEGRKQVGDHPEITNYEAKMVFIKKDYSNALSIWKRAFPKLAKQGDLSTSFAYRDAAVAAANLNDWSTAADYFKLATKYTSKQLEVLYEAQCLADYGFSLWKLKKYKECIEIYAKVIDLFPKLPDPKDNLRALGLLKVTSNSLIYFRKTLKPEERDIGMPYVEPAPGAHSQTDFSETLKSLPIPPYNSLWVLLAQLENVLESGDLAFIKMKKIYNDLPVLFQAEAKRIEIERLIKSKKLDDVLQIMIDYFALTKLAVEHENRHELVQPLTQEDINSSFNRFAFTMLNMLALCIISFASKQPFGELPLASWKTTAEKTGLDKYTEWHKFIECISSMTIESARKIIKDGSEDVCLRILASIFILVNDEDRDYSLYASALLTTTFKDYSTFSWGFEYYLVDLLVSRWTGIAQFLHDMYHSEEFALVLSICADKKLIGLKKAAKIVLAAKDICFLKIDSVEEKLKDIANT